MIIFQIYHQVHNGRLYLVCLKIIHTTTSVRISAMGVTAQIPSIPKYRGNIKIPALSNTMLRNEAITSDNAGRSMAV